MTGSRRLQLLAQDGAETSIEGSFIYKTFFSVVDYAEYFRGMRKVASRGLEVAERIFMPEPQAELLRDIFWPPLLIDNYIQLAGLHLNFLQDRNEKEIYVCTNISQLQHSPNFSPQRLGPWEVFSRSEHTSTTEFVSDIFVFDPRNENLVVAILGVHFTMVLTNSLAGTLSRMSPGEKRKLPTREHHHALRAGSGNKDLSKTWAKETFASVALRPRVPKAEGSGNVFIAVRQMLNRVTDVPIDDMGDHSRLEAIGVDSLMTIEVLDEIENVFNITIPMPEFQELVDLQSLCLCIKSKSHDSFGPVALPESTSDTI